MDDKTASKNISTEGDKLMEELIQTLPQEKDWVGSTLYQYQGFWYPFFAPKAVIAFQNHVKAHETDIFLITTPKSGTTWLKALIFSIVNRNQFPLTQSPLLTANPHELVPFIDFNIYSKNQTPDLENENFPSPRIFATHTPYGTLPSSILKSNCRIVYLCRNPLDQFISDWHFIVDNFPRNEDFKPFSIEEGFDRFCKGIHAYGPFWEHVLGYWKMSLEHPEKVLFLKYEDLKKDIASNLKKLADFLGYPFSEEEIRQGVVEEISKLCRFETLKTLEVNITGESYVGLKNSAFFRNGKVGDWVNFINPPMADRMKQLSEEKLGDSGLKFDLLDKEE
ncbi:PREDICTED: cytosolic sulfotransferase 15 [Theobroma cacao]|uniref:Sulfotransferase n=1 Tax=Theobroma cacao TaxID=3641 RepID=A0AB32WL99_THECC|nr:PREDICTED: cytosolic sulfotransferase 15 [Theobroma cacao]